MFKPNLTRVRRNTLFKILGESSRVFQVTLMVLIARILGGSTFGSFSVALALATFFAVVADGGLNQLLIRDIARDPGNAQPRVDLTFSIKLLLTPIVLIVLMGFMTLCHYPAGMIRLGFDCGLVAITKGWLDYGFALFSGHEQMQFESLLKWGNQCFALLAGSWVLFHQGSIHTLILAWAGVNGLSLIVAYGLLIRRGIAPAAILFNRSLFTALLKETYPLTISVLFSSLFIRIDIIMLSLFHRMASEIGQFAAGTRVIEAIGTLPMLITSALFPIIADKAKNQPEQFIGLLKKWRLRFLGIGVTAAVALITLRFPLIRWTFGAEYETTIQLLFPLALMLPAMFLNYWYMGSLIVLGEQRMVALSTVSAIGVNVLLNLVFIPRWGATGAAMTMILVQCTWSLLAHVRLRKYESRS